MLSVAAVMPGAAANAQPPVAASAPVVQAAEGAWDFDWPALPWHDAMQRYTEVTGRSVLYADAPDADFRSTPLQGRFTADQALAHLIAGSGMVVRYATAHAVTLKPLAALLAAPASSKTFSAAEQAAHERYRERLETRVLNLLCRDARIEAGTYRLVLRFGITELAALDVQHVIAVQQPEQEQRVRAALTGQILERPPAGFGQPVTMLLTPRKGGRQGVCAP